MKTAFAGRFCGVSANSMLGALPDLGLDIAVLNAKVAKVLGMTFGMPISRVYAEVSKAWEQMPPREG